MRSIALWALGCGLMLTTAAQDKGPHFLSHPVLSPDGQTLVFAFEGDLWKTNIREPQATRLTAMQGYESNPRISPDGKWLAFTGRQLGNADVYIMPLAGGEIKQLTYHSANDEVNNWSWDGKTIYFTSTRTGQVAGFTVPITGGTPKRLFGDHYFQFDHALAEHPSGEIYFNDTWESYSQVTRKRYKGPFNPDLQSYNPKTGQYKRHTDWEGKDFAATIDKNGKVYFISDEANGEYNLYALENGKKTALTRFNTSIKTPFVNANGDKVVFEKDYQLWLYDVASKKTEKINVNLPRNYVLPADKDYNIRGSITDLSISPDGKKLAFVSRGEIFVSDADGKFIKQLDKGNTERADQVLWTADNKTLVFNQTINGYLNWFTITADGSAPIKQLTNEARNNRLGVLNKAKTKMVYLSGRDEVRLLDLKSWQNTTIVKDEVWAFQNATPGFSPNDEYVLFTAYRNFEQDVFVHHIANKTTTNLTNSGITETSPIWSPDSKYIYFISSRTKPAYPFGLQSPHIYRMPLEKIDQPYRSDKYDALFKAPEKKDTTKKDPPPIKIDAHRIMERIEQVGPNFGSQYLAAVVQRGEKTHVLYASNHAEGRPALWKTTLEPFEAPKTEKVNGIDGFGGTLVESGEKIMVLNGGNIYKLNLDANKVDPVSVGYVFRRNLSGEFTQMFQETWAHVNEGFYDEKFHGIDWNATRKRYEVFLPALNNRGDLRTLLSDLLGELNSSHQGFSSFGVEESVQLSNRTMETGIVFDNNDPYKVKSILQGSNADKASIDIRPGDVLVRVNNVEVDKSMNRNFYFSKPTLDNELSLQFNRGGQMVDVNVHPQGSLGNDLYNEWADNNQQRVDERTKGRVAYHNMRDMGTGELEKFLIDMTQDFYQKDALILDLRYNTGGNVHDEVLRFLSQRSYLKWKYREGKLTPQSNFAPADKPIVLLINEQSLSDAEMTSQGFKALKLGTIIGMPTYRWIIFTSGTGLVDGSFVRLPSWGCYSLEGNDLEMHGVEPDIKVPMNFEDRLMKRDPQLDRAIDEILKKLK